MSHPIITHFQTEQEIIKEVKRFRRYLKREELATNSIDSYTYTLHYFLSTYHIINLDNLLSYKGYLMENFSPRTVNLRLLSLNRYFKFAGHKFYLKSIKIQQAPFLENVISMQDYKYLKRKLKKEEDLTMYFLIWGIACTGARISEALTFKVEHIMDGQLDFYGKGKKYRRIYFVQAYRKECLQWLESINRTSGYIFLRNDGNPMSVKDAERIMKQAAKKYSIDSNVLYPHSFRHLFGKTFYDEYKDLPLLADLMGHASIETTRIYARRTSSEQAAIMNKVVKW